MSLGCFVSIGVLFPFSVFFVGFGMNFVHAVKTYAHVLPRVDELYELIHGTVKLSDDVLHRKHHTKGHAAMYHSSGGKDCNQDVLNLIDGDASCLLHLLQVQGLQINLEKVGLHILPLP